MFPHTRLWVAALIIIVVVVGIFVLSVPRAREVASPTGSTTASAQLPITYHDSYKKGMHTITGTVMVPDACTTITADASLDTTSGSPRIELALSVPTDDQICLQVPTRLSFSVTVAASASTPIDVLLNGEMATSTLQ